MCILLLYDNSNTNVQLVFRLMAAKTRELQRMVPERYETESGRDEETIKHKQFRDGCARDVSVSRNRLIT